MRCARIVHSGGISRTWGLSAMDGLRVTQQISEIKELHNFFLSELPNYSSSTELSSKRNQNRIQAAVPFLFPENCSGVKTDTIPERTTTEITSRAILASKRKHDVMSPIEPALNGGARFDSASKYTRPTGFGLLQEDNATNKVAIISDQTPVCWLDSTANLIPEACGESDLTAEHYMAESSKSSCFDDACTLALDSVTTAAESATTTGLRHFEETKQKLSDLNNSILQTREEEVNGDENADQSRYDTREKISSLRHEEGLTGHEDYTQPSSKKLQRTETLYSVSGDNCMLGTDSKSWLQLGIGTVSKNSNISSRKETQLDISRSITIAVQNALEGRKEQELSRILPFQLEQSHARKLLPASPLIHHPGAAGLSSAPGSGDEDRILFPISFLASTSGAKSDRLLTDVAALESRSNNGVGESLDYLVHGAKDASEPQLKRSYGSAPPAQGPDSAALSPSQSTKAYMQMTVDEYIPHHSRVGNLSSFLQPIAACGENQRFVRSNAELHQGYQLPPSDGRTSLSQSYSEHLQLCRAMNVQGRGSPLIPQDNQNSVFRPQDFLQNFQSRPGNFSGQLITDRGVSFAGESGHGTARASIQKNQIIVPQEWQQITKRIGTNMAQFQSVIPGGTIPVGSGSSNFQHTIQELEFAALQQAKYASQNSLASWSGKDFRVPSCNPLVRPDDAAPLTNSPDDPANGVTRLNHLLPHIEYGASAKIPANYDQSAYLLQPWHSTVSGSMYLPLSRRPVAYNTTATEKLRVTSSPRDQWQPGLWFVLQASDNSSRQMEYGALPQISKGYVRVKDETVQVSYVKKYLANKLELSCESEVDLTCKGQLLDSNLTLQYVRDNIWFADVNIDKTSNEGRDNTLHGVPTNASSFPKDAIMVLTYIRKSSSIPA